MSKSRTATLPTDKPSCAADAGMLARTDVTMDELERWIISLGGRELTAEEIRARSAEKAMDFGELSEYLFDPVLTSARVAET